MKGDVLWKAAMLGLVAGLWVFLLFITHGTRDLVDLQRGMVRCSYAEPGFIEDCMNKEGVVIDVVEPAQHDHPHPQVPSELLTEGE